MEKRIIILFEKNEDGLETISLDATGMNTAELVGALTLTMKRITEDDVKIQAQRLAARALNKVMLDHPELAEPIKDAVSKLSERENAG